MASAVHFGISEEKYRDDGPAVMLLSSILTVRLLSFLTTTRVGRMERKIIWKLSWRSEWKTLSICEFYLVSYRDKKPTMSAIIIVNNTCRVFRSMRINCFGETASFHNYVHLNISDLTFQSRPFYFTSAARTYCTCCNWVQLCSSRDQCRRINAWNKS